MIIGLEVFQQIFQLDLILVLNRRKHIKAGVLVTSPIGGRYHPLIIGQAAATIDNLFPGRFKLGVGSGEAVNENNFLTIDGQIGSKR